MIRVLALLFGLATTLPGQAAEEVVADLSADSVSITARFDGSEILVYGAVKRDAPVPAGGPLEVIITAEGPLEPVTVRRKSAAFGLWVNSVTVDMAAAPGFYAVATTGAFADAISDADDQRLRVSVPQAIIERRAGAHISDAPAFTEALIRLREAGGMYQQNEGGVTLTDDTLFSTALSLPATVTEGNYRVRILLSRDLQIIDAFETVIGVRKEGLERWLFSLSREAPLAYGLLALALAALSGWAASALFRLLMRP